MTKLTDLELVKELLAKIDDLVFFETQANILWKNSEITRPRKTALEIELLDMRNIVYAVKREFSIRDKLMERAVIKHRAKRITAEETINLEGPRRKSST